MIKKLTLSILCVMALSLTACASGESSGNDNETRGQETSVAEKENVTKDEEKEDGYVDEYCEKLLTRWEVDDSYINKHYYETCRWNGEEHKACEDDDKSLKGENLLRSTLSGKHSFMYRGLSNAEDDVLESFFEDGALLNMNEFFYMLTNEEMLTHYDIEGYAFVDMDADGENELVFHGQNAIMEAYLVFYIRDNSVYLTSVGGEQVSELKTDGSFSNRRMIGTIELAGKNPVVKYSAWDDNIYSDAGTFIKGEAYIDGMQVTESEYEAYIKNWSDDTENVDFVEFTTENLDKEPDYEEAEAPATKEGGTVNVADKWNIDSSYIGDYDGMWDDDYHKTCEDDDKYLEGEALLKSVAIGNRSFIYKSNNESSGDLGISMGASLNMNELFYVLSNGKKTANMDITGFAMEDITGDGKKELVIEGKTESLYTYIVIYDYKGIAYMTEFSGWKISRINNDGTFEGPGKEPVYLDVDNMTPVVKYKAWHINNTSGNTGYFTEDKLVGYEEYLEYIIEWNSQSDKFTLTEFTMDNLKNM